MLFLPDPAAARISVMTTNSCSHRCCFQCCFTWAASVSCTQQALQIKQVLRCFAYEYTHASGTWRTLHEVRIESVVVAWSCCLVIAFAIFSTVFEKKTRNSQFQKGSWTCTLHLTSATQREQRTRSSPQEPDGRFVWTLRHSFLPTPLRKHTRKKNLTSWCGEFRSGFRGAL